MLQRSALVLATTLLATPAVAQDATDSWSGVKISDLLSTATVLDESGALWSGEVVRLNADGLDLVQANGEERHFTVAQVRRLETIGKCGVKGRIPLFGLYQILFGEFKPCRDSIKNGGLIGAGLGAVVGLGVARGGGLTGTEGGLRWVGYPLFYGAILGAIGMAADFIGSGQRRLTLYQAAAKNSVQRDSFGGRGPLAGDADGAALHEHARDGWMLGVSLGSGSGKYEDSETGIASSSEPGGLFTFRVGRMIQPSLLLDAELTFWGREETTGAAYIEELTLTNLALAGTFYPLDRLSRLLGGMYVRAGIGSGRITKINSDVNNISLRYHETGLGLLLGAGYELRVTKKLALGVGVSFDKLSIGGDVYESAQLIGYALDLNRYF